MLRWSRAAFGLAPLLVLGACAAPPPPPPTPPEVTVAQPQRRDVTSYAEFVGNTVAFQRADVKARVAGFLEKVSFQAAQRVKKDQLLFVIEQAPYQAQRDQADAALRSAQANLERAQSDLERLEVAVQTNAVSQQDVTRARAEATQAESSVLSARAQLAQAEIQLQYTEVRSPLAGQVGRRQVDKGNLVGQGEATLLTTVVQIDPVYVFFNLPEDMVLRLLGDLRKQGVDRVEDVADPEVREMLKFFVGTQIDEGHPHEGYLDYISNEVDAGTGTVEVRGVVDNSERRLMPGVFVRVRVPGRLLESSLLVAERAIGTDLGGKYVMVVGQNDEVEQRSIELGPREDDGFVVVSSGLEGSERYIINGMLRARPGFPVTPKTESAVEGGEQPDPQG